MARKQRPERLENIYQMVEEHPGKRPSFIANLLGWQRSEVTRRLPALENQGYLLSEDECGRLWPFHKKQS